MTEGKLYLTSYRVPFPGELERLVGSPLDECRAALLINAKDSREEPYRTQKLTKAHEYWKDLVGEANLVDLLAYPELGELVSDLSEYDLVVGLGGDQVSLNDAMRMSGFNRAIGKLLESSVYVGESAGSMVAGPSLKHCVGGDVRPNHEFSANALGLIDELIIPHDDSLEEKYANRGTELKQQFPEENILPLGDAQVVVVENGQLKVLGDRVEPSAV